MNCFTAAIKSNDILTYSLSIFSFVSHTVNYPRRIFPPTLTSFNWVIDVSSVSFLCIFAYFRRPSIRMTSSWWASNHRKMKHSVITRTYLTESSQVISYPFASLKKLRQQLQLLDSGINKNIEQAWHLTASNGRYRSGLNLSQVFPSDNDKSVAIRWYSLIQVPRRRLFQVEHFPWMLFFDSDRHGRPADPR